MLKREWLSYVKHCRQITMAKKNNWSSQHPFLVVFILLSSSFCIEKATASICYDDFCNKARRLYFFSLGVLTSESPFKKILVKPWSTSLFPRRSLSKKEKKILSLQSSRFGSKIWKTFPSISRQKLPKFFETIQELKYIITT